MAAASSFQAIQALYDYAAASTANLEAVRAEYESAVAAGLLSKGGTASLTSASKNGVSYSVVSGLPEVDRIAALRLALAYVDAGIRPSSKSYARF